MKKILFFAMLAAIAFTSCKTVKQPAQSPYTSDDTVTEKPKVFSVPTTKTSNPETVKKETAKIANEKPIAVRKEQVSFTQQTDRTQNEKNTFFVIIGSFSQLDNAKTYRETLLSSGFESRLLFG